MRILFLHNNFPGQYRRLMQYLADDTSIEMVAGTLATNSQTFPISRVNYKPHREVTQAIHPAAATTESAILTAQAAFQGLYPLKQRGWRPDIVCAHSGWGPALFLRELWPDTKLLSYFEWYYQPRGSDADFLDDGDRSEDSDARTRMRNAPILMDIAQMDWGVSPTRWQLSQFPDHLTARISVLHDGVDTDYLVPDGDATLEVDGVTLTAKDEVVTYVARGMEPYRGFPQFMEAVARLQKHRPNLHTVIVGDDRVAYGTRRKDGKSYKEHALETLDLDTSRVHFLGLVPFATFRSVIQISSVHVYLTVPFVLSWSMLESMSCGALIVASDTPPVREVIADGLNGLLTDFFDTERLAARVEEAIENQVKLRPLRLAARQTALDRYAAKNLVPAHRQLMIDVATGTLPGRGK
ncbi:glycosyltransferase [Rhodobium gokarnense]|uniref:Glycosyltransferase involved in cell wall biosynthesis n=1 Tax=Rhodobium gokarnense TaxID=364296 RepID=A0ABT3HCU8_9HYPH|nr:glycosyltransferase [Rhodobium gokarnense]MCW2308164.1 glycosyltransferase involved in cell wall biosynthesis [Rhodobium gokarnense]